VARAAALERVDVSGGIAIFVKTPGYSAVKTRLAAGIGEQAAQAWYQRAAAAVAAVAQRAAAEQGASVYWAIAETAALTHGAWSFLPRLPQGEGGLGGRMGRDHATLVERHGAGVLLGADTPQIAAVLLRRALQWCGHPLPRHVLGPARDGGFWLYAGNRVTPIAVWESVTYSRPDTAQQFRRVLKAPAAWLELPTLTDVDSAADLSAMDTELASLSGLLPEQIALRTWLAANRS
jgi:glycosyltransferase A (GT-A) superfamily protein (DUF2064 family)